MYKNENDINMKKWIFYAIIVFIHLIQTLLSSSASL